MFPYNGDAERKIPQHPMNRWDNNKGEPDIVYVAKFGNSLAYRDLPNDLKTDNIAAEFGATSETVASGGTVVCGSHGEIANDPSRREEFDFRNNEKRVTSQATMDNAKDVVWYEQAVWAPDQFRQRMAFSLSEMITVVPSNIEADALTEPFLKFYDVFVKNVSRVC